MLRDVDVRHQILTRSGADFSAVWPFFRAHIFGPSDRRPGAFSGSLGPPGASWGPPGASWGLLGASLVLPGPPGAFLGLAGGAQDYGTASWCFLHPSKPPPPPTYPTTCPPYLLACLPTCFLTAQLPTCFQNEGKLQGQVLILLPSPERCEEQRQNLTLQKSTRTKTVHEAWKEANDGAGRQAGRQK